MEEMEMLEAIKPQMLLMKPHLEMKLKQILVL